jgi:maltose/maltodextrin transport system substrate-binding protein
VGEQWTKARILLLSLLAVAILGACGARPEKRELVVWTDMTESRTLGRAASRFTARTGMPVKIVRVPLIELKPKFQVAAPVNHGPDLVTGPHDWIGPLATAGLIAPVALKSEDLNCFLPVGLSVMTFQGKLYGLPVAIDTMGLIYNKNLIQSPPKTMEELIVKAKELTKGDTSGFLYDINDFYFAWPFFGGYGAYIFKKTSSGLDPNDIGLDGPEAEKAAQLILDLIKKHRLMEVEITKDIASGRFMDNKLAMTLDGNWALVEYKKKRIPYGFVPIPKLENGKNPSPLVGVLGIMLNRRSRHPELAMELMKELCSRESQVEIYLEGGRIPARLDAQEDRRIAQEPVIDHVKTGAALGGLSLLMEVTYVPNSEIKGILESAALGTPMPNIPALDLVWQPMKEALQLMNLEKLSPREALKQAGERMRKDIKRMME